MVDSINSTDIAIVGGGASAVCLLEALTRSNIPAGRITVFDPSPNLWCGRAYQQDSEVLRLNNVPGGMSVSSSDPGHFERWLTARKLIGGRDCDDWVDPYSGVPFVPRSVYGEYLESTSEDCMTLLMAQGWKIDLVRECVVSARPLSPRGALFHVGSGRRFRADRMVLCVGRGTPRDSYGLAGHPRFVADPYPVSEKLDIVAPRDEVAILGSGLTAIDVLLALGQRGHQGPIHVLSRRGVLPPVRQQPIKYQIKHFTPERFQQAAAEGTVTLETVARILNEELAQVGEDLDNVTTEVAALSKGNHVARLRHQLSDVDPRSRALRIMQQAVPKTGPQVWPLLSDPQKMELLHKHYRTILALCCPMPPSSAAGVLSMIDSGQVQIASDIQQVTGTADGFTVSTSSQSFRPSVVINAVNAPADQIPGQAAPLVDSLVAAGVAARNPAGGVHVEPSTGRLSVEGRPSPVFQALGDLTFGTFFFTFGIPAIVQRAEEIVSAITD